ncbi:acyltransferase ChoActase/COT/CPT [Mycena belliarum]|uniref:Acyltransferase ChoActase/COT/CPT n=1 Tax=Mycena belliarum TaxID=1033014 RepID=A0AAD6ULD4_9AGAR|nr:acyltransferase ChoActase/COT/CPT [Mycena belliae]
MLPTRLGLRPFMRSSSTKAVPNALSLPRLQVPELRKTLDRYLRSLEPFLLEDEAHGGLPFHSAYTLRAKWADEFAAGVGSLCQERLLALDRASPNNWLDDNFWIKKAYLEWRSPLLVNSNWWLAFEDDTQIPVHAKEEMSDITPWQVRRGAWLVHRVLCFKDRLDQQELYPETTRTGIWLRDSVSKMFNSARIPKPICDLLSKPPKPTQPDALKIYVMVHNWCYAIPVYHPASPPKLMGVQEIEMRIRSVVADARKRLAAGERAIPIGALTADERDKWTVNLQHLLGLSPQNEQTHHAICHSLLGLSLDGASPSSPLTGQEGLTSHLLSIRSTNSNVANRIFDKPCTIIVDPSTRAGCSGEHSPCDALVPSIVAEWALVDRVDASCFSDPEPAPFPSKISDSAASERLDWVVDAKLEAECANAVARAKSIIDDSDGNVFWFQDYGTDWIKNTLRQSPDAYIQMVLQLAYFKTRGEFTATYETALTRMFKRGRTETIRTFTKESRAWVLGMVDGNASQQHRRNLLHHALHTHSTLTREAATGRGIDRHLLGLRLMLRPLSGEEAPLFDDELFQRSQTWKLSTSGLSAGNLFRGTGFGAMYDDGYGINYLAAPDMIKFGIESKFSCAQSSTDALKDAIFEALYEMRTLCLATDGAVSESVQATSRL